MGTLDKNLRNALEKTIKDARSIAEVAARAALEQIGVGEAASFAYLDEPTRALRRRLRAHGRQLGDVLNGGKVQSINHLVQEVAYQHWHRMLFARFLADNDLLMYDGVAITLEECEELAPDEGAHNGWELAGKLAARMLPQIFKSGSPVFALSFAPEHQSELERLLKDLPVAVFKASDSLGWVYQFWQADAKDRINQSEVKIGADELPAVTQLFTEPYMVAFLLHNSLGAWWATRHPGEPCPVPLDYFRTLEDGAPAAGAFAGWPASLADFKLLDPCCGSGHFLVASFLMLVPMRMAAEGLTAREAVSRVLAENIHGLELDPRCVEIAVFAVALEAWRYADESGRPLGVRAIPAPNIACCGLKVAAKVEDWQALVPDDSPDSAYLREGLAGLHRDFSQAPLLGSLLDPGKAKGDLFTADYTLLSHLLEVALRAERQPDLWEDTSAVWDLALSARGLLDAARLMEGRYHLVITNVPYLTRGKQSDALKAFCDSHYKDAKNDLANVFLERCLELALPTSPSGKCLRGEEKEGEGAGVVQIVMPQNWLFLTSYRNQRESLLKRVQWNLLVRLGPGAFETITGEVVQAILLTQTHALVPEDFMLCGMDASAPKVTQEKAALLREGELVAVSQIGQLGNPDARVALKEKVNGDLLEIFAYSHEGLTTGDIDRFVRKTWEIQQSNDWVKYIQNTTDSIHYHGRTDIIHWGINGEIVADFPGSFIKGKNAWDNVGLRVTQMKHLPVTLYTGEVFGKNAATVIPREPSHLPAIWCFCSSLEYFNSVRQIDHSLKVTNATLVKVPFDLTYWQEIADKRYPYGLPAPYSDDPTQWIFHGHPCGSVEWDEQMKRTTVGSRRVDLSVLHVAVARLLGYRWPAETDSAMELADEARAWVNKSQHLASHADQDGIVCIPPVGREASAADRLLNLLADAYEDAWSNDVLAQLLNRAHHAGKSLESWLRDKFFSQHCELFHQRPFIWHIWDGLSDGFAALVNYHKLNYKTLEALSYTYLGDWIGRQKRDADHGVDGAQEKLAAAEALKRRLELILEGEAPYDIFVRWKPIDQQPIGWNPDLNDGVRLNIRPFLSVPDIGRRGAGVLRERPKVKWDKDRGTDVPSSPWYELGLSYGGKRGDRINDHHLTLTKKRAAREKAK